MKQRFSSLDVKVIAHELSNALCTLRLANVYDLSSRIFLLKFAKPNQRQQMIIDSGFRCHLTSFTRATAAAPSAFVTRLRKYLRTRRVTSVSQVGTDRIIEFQFSDGQYKLFLEFYAGGNIVLADKELTILALLRTVSEEQEQELRVGLKYSLENRQNYGGTPVLSKERIRDGLSRALERSASEGSAPAKKSKKKPGDALRKALATSLNEFPPMLVDHAFRIKGFDPAIPIKDVLENDSLSDKLLEVLEEANRVVADITSAEIAKGYIVAKIVKAKPSGVEGDQGKEAEDVIGQKGNFLYEDFHPFRPRQFEGNPEIRILEFEGFNRTVDEFFSSIESQKLESRLTEREENARKKLEAARKDHQKRVGGLQEVQELNIRKAQAVEANLQRVHEAIAAVNGLIAQGMDWVEIARLIEMEQARQNPVAEIIKLPLKLYENTVTLLLAEVDFDDQGDYEGDETDSEISGSEGDGTDNDVSDSEVSDNEDEGVRKKDPPNPTKAVDKRLAIDIDLALSPWSNASQYYDHKKTAAVKEQKTLQSSAIALKSTEKKINADLKRGLKQEKQVLRPLRKQLWFEKFYYFISSDGYLVLGGRDAQQNETLYKKYLAKGDIYVHSDISGSASVIIKNRPNTPDAPIPPSTLSQAGTLAVATSSAWDSKAVMSAWWVNSDQVSKTAPTGEYLTTGGFMIRGKKNFLPPAQLLLGFGVMFQISEESKARHLKHRLHDEDPKKESASNNKAELEEDVLATESDMDDGKGDGKGDEIDEEDQGHEVTDSSDSDHESEHQPSESDGEGNSGEDNEEHMTGNYSNPLQSNGRPANYGDGLHVNTSPQSNDELGQNSTAEVDNDSAGSEIEESGDKVQPDNALTFNKDSLKSGVRHLSAKERRLLRKGAPLPIDSRSQQPSTTSSGRDLSADSNMATASTSTRPSSQPQPPRVRGKHGQRSKQKTKYANQDPEDRALALRLLGSAAATEKAAADAVSKAERDAALAAQKERRREQHQRTVQAGKELEEIRRLNLEEGLVTLDSDEEAELTLLDSWVGTPLPGDEILDLLVVCAPWDAIGSKLRWRVKMQPGAMKKGKAVREILGSWVKGIGDRERKKRMPGVGDEGFEEERGMRREGELIRGLRKQEIVGVVP
ncbi:MAG: hypothetical protein Q9187_005638, partial [Circinaria calcarea]